jgi:hypothetical protein
MSDTGFKVFSMKINYLEEWEVANFHGQTSDVYAYV